MRSTLLALLFVPFMLGSPCEARQATGGLRDVSAIQDGRGSTRVLFRLQDEIRTLTDVSIWKATLRVPLLGVPAERSLHLRIYPVTGAWSAGTVTWTGGWTRGGGDFDEEVFAERELDLRASPTEIVIDVTRLLKETLEEGLSSEGFILSVDPRTGVGLPIADLTRFGLLGATLDVKYRKTPPAPAARRAG